jgi:hypothetical protein
MLILVYFAINVRPILGQVIFKRSGILSILRRSVDVDGLGQSFRKFFNSVNPDSDNWEGSKCLIKIHRITNPIYRLFDIANVEQVDD